MKFYKGLISIISVIIIIFTFCSCENDFVNNAYFGIQNENELSKYYESYKEISKDSLEIYFLDVGQADSALVLCNGKSMLIDGGNRADGEFVCSFLKNLGISEIDYVVNTHAHEDHIGGLIYVAREFKMKNIIVSPATHNTAVAETFLNTVSKQGYKIEKAKVGEKFDFGEAKIQIVGPINNSGTNLNDTSIVLRISYKGKSILFTGDATKVEEKEILNAGYVLDSDILKVAHHGSGNSSSYVFLREVNPKYAVCSVAIDNDYGHPSEDALSRLRDVGATIYLTSEMGTICCSISNNGKIQFHLEND